MAYTVDLKSTINQDIWVQIPSLAPFENYKNFCYNIYRKLRKKKQKDIYYLCSVYNRGTVSEVYEEVAKATAYPKLKNSLFSEI